MQIEYSSGELANIGSKEMERCLLHVNSTIDDGIFYRHAWLV